MLLIKKYINKRTKADLQSIAALLPEDANALKYRQAVSDRLQNVTKPDSRRSSDAGAGVSGREGGKGICCRIFWLVTRRNNFIKNNLK